MKGHTPAAPSAAKLCRECSRSSTTDAHNANFLFQNRELTSDGAIHVLRT